MKKSSLVALLVAAVLGAGVPVASAARVRTTRCVDPDQCICVIVWIGGTPVEVCTL